MPNPREMSSASSDTLHMAGETGRPEKQPLNVSQHTLRRYPWRQQVTPFETILNHPYKGSGTEEDPYVVDWLPEDPEDPQKWNDTYKWFQVVIASLATLAVALTSSAYTGGIASLQKQFPVHDPHGATLFWTGGVSLFVLGFAFGPLLWAPASEVFGRRPIYIISYFFLTLWQGVSIASPNRGSILVFRALAGFFGSSPLANAGGTVSDVLTTKQLGYGMILFSIAPFLGPAVGPISGGFLGMKGGWKWVTGMLTMFCFAIFALITVFGSETYAPILLRRRADKLSKLTGKVYRFRADVDKPFNAKTLFTASLLRPWKFLFLEPIVLLLSIYVAIIYGVLYLNFAAYPIIFSQMRGWNSGVEGLAFLGILVGVLLAVIIMIVFTAPAYQRRVKARGWAEPEDRLLPAMWASVIIVIGLACFAGTNGPNVHWIVPIIFGVPFGMGMVVLFIACLGYLVDTYTVYAASVLAANSVLRSLFGAAFPLFTHDMYNNLGIHWASAIPAFLAFACLPFPFLFYKYGKQIRAKCKYASEAAAIMAQIVAARRAAAAEQDVEKTANEVPNETDPQFLDLERSMSMEHELRASEIHRTMSRVSQGPAPSPRDN